MNNRRDVLRIAAAEVGYREVRTNRQKYSRETPGLAWSDGQPWCASFLCWVFYKAGASSLLPVVSPSCDRLAAGFSKAGQWGGMEPRVGALVFYGKPYDYEHVGIVESFDDRVIHTIEGNTNDEGSREGYEVARRVRYRSSTWIQGYAYPAYAPILPPVRTPNLDHAEADMIAASKVKRPTLAASAVTEALRAVRRARRLTRRSAR